MNTNGSKSNSQPSLREILLDELDKMDRRKKFRVKVRYDNYGDDEEYAIDREAYNFNRGR